MNKMRVYRVADDPDVMNYTVSQKTFPFYILNNSVKSKSISIIFGEQYLEKISHQKIANSKK